MKSKPKPKSTLRVVDTSRAADAPTAYADFITEAELARRLSIAPATLRKYRHEGKPPPYRKLGKHVRYDWAEVCAWLDTTRRLSTSPTVAELDARQERNNRKRA